MTTANIFKVLNNLNQKYAKTFTYNSTNVDGVFNFGNKLSLNKEFAYTLKLDAFYGWENIINITAKNNKFQYSVDNGVTWINIIIPPGIWNFSDITKHMHNIMKTNSHYKAATSSTAEDYYVNFIVDKNEYKIKLVITQNDYQVNFNVDNSINQVFGFTKSSFNKGNHTGKNLPDIASTQTILIVIDLIQPNVLQTKNGVTKGIQYVRSIPAFSRPTGARIEIHDAFPTKYRLLESAYDSDSCTIKLLDEDLKPINTAGDEFTIVFTIESA